MCTSGTCTKEYTTTRLAIRNLTKSHRPVDAVLLPAAPSASFRPGEGIYFGKYYQMSRRVALFNCVLLGYTGVANVLDYSVVTVPVTTVDKTRDVQTGNAERTSDLDKLIGSHCKLYSLSFFT